MYIQVGTVRDLTVPLPPKTEDTFKRRTPHVKDAKMKLLESQER